MSLSWTAHSRFSIIFSYLTWFNGQLNELRLACGRTSHCVNEPWKGQAHITVRTVLIISSVSDTQPIYQKSALSISTDAERFIKTTYSLMVCDPLPTACLLLVSIAPTHCLFCHQINVLKPVLTACNFSAVSSDSIWNNSFLFSSLIITVIIMYHDKNKHNMHKLNFTNRAGH